MSYNLLCEPWIPLSDGVGSEWWATPAEAMLARHGWRIAWPRADFTGATHEFLIGLLSVAMMPETTTEWRAALEAPPDPEALDRVLAPLVEAFDLDGDGPRFLQDPSCAEEGRESGVATLLIDSPGDNALTRNLDFFVKRERADGMCWRCAAAALYTLQAYAPSGGKGHRTSLRGGGPLTTLVLGDTVWRTLWSNVLPRRALRAKPIQVEGDPSQPGPVFPWMGPLRTSDGARPETTTADAPWLQVFFGQPRRIWLDFDGAEPGACGVCGEEAGSLVRRWRTRPYGVDYASTWSHPLSPYTLDPKQPGLVISRKGTPAGPDWRDWLGLVEARPETEEGRRPARVIEEFREARGEARREFRLWAFGYDCDNMKARGWNDAEMPILPSPEDGNARKLMVGQVVLLIGAADEALSALVYAIKRALSERSGDVKGEFTAERAEFLASCRPRFEAALRELNRRALDGEKLGRTGTEALRRDWHRSLVGVALSVYGEATDALPLTDDDPAREMKDRKGPAVGRQLLRRALYGSRMEKALGIALRRTPGTATDEAREHEVTA